MRFFLGFLFFNCFLIYAVQAQTSGILDGYVQTGLESNLALKQKEFIIDKNLAALDEAKGLFLPTVSFEAAYTAAKGGRSLNFPIGDLLNPVYSTLNTLTGTNNFPTVENVNTQFLPNDFHDTKIRAIHPLLNMEIKYNRDIKKQMIGLQEAEVNVYKRQLVADIKTAYFRYLQSLKAIEIYRNAKTLVQENLKVNEKLLKNDKIVKDVIYRSQAEISDIEYQILQAENNQKLARNYFNFLLNQGLETDIQVDSNFVKSIAPNNFIKNEGQAADREELDKINKAITLNETQQRMNKSFIVPKINHVLDLGFQGFGYKFNSEQAYLLYNITLSWNIFKGFQNKAKIQQTSIDKQVLETQYSEVQQQFDLQVQSARYGLELSLKSQESLKNSQTSAEEFFRLVNRRYNEGQALQIEFLDARNRLTTAQIRYTLSQYDILIKLTDLERVTAGYDLKQ